MLCEPLSEVVEEPRRGSRRPESPEELEEVGIATSELLSLLLLLLSPSVGLSPEVEASLVEEGIATSASESDVAEGVSRPSTSLVLVLSLPPKRPPRRPSSSSSPLPLLLLAGLLATEGEAS